MALDEGSGTHGTRAESDGNESSASIVPTPVEPTARTRALRSVLALLVAAASDGLSLAFAFAPPLQIGADLLTAGLLFAILGFRWPLLPALIVEAIPGLSLFPTWTLVVGALATLGGRPKRRVD